MSHLSIRLKAGERAALERRAADDGLSLSAFARKLLVEDAPSEFEKRLESLESRIGRLESPGSARFRCPIPDCGEGPFGSGNATCRVHGRRVIPA